MEEIAGLVTDEQLASTGIQEADDDKNSETFGSLEPWTLEEAGDEYNDETFGDLADDAETPDSYLQGAVEESLAGDWEMPKPKPPEIREKTRKMDVC